MNKNLALFLALIAVTAIVVYLFFFDTNEGGAYKSRQALCVDFAQSYLKTISKTEPEFSDKKWHMTVDVETDLYNLCLADLSEESLKKFELTGLGKYRDEK